MSERSRGSRRLGRRGLFLLLLAAGCGKGPPDYTYRSGARLIDRYCQSGSYVLNGAADMVVGVTDDSCGFVLGPGQGNVTVPAATEILVWSESPGDAQWTHAGISEDTSSSTIANPPGETWHVVDVRQEITVTPPPDPGCSGGPY